MILLVLNKHLFLKNNNKLIFYFWKVVLEDGVFSICFINSYNQNSNSFFFFFLRFYFFSILHLGNCLIFLIGGSILFKNLLNQTGNKIFSNLQISSNNSRKEKLKLITCLILSFIWILDLITYLGLYAIFSIDMFFIPLLNFICWVNLWFFIF